MASHDEKRIVVLPTNQMRLELACLATGKRDRETLTSADRRSIAYRLAEENQ